jgi:gliding motility-associated-like protein
MRTIFLFGIMLLAAVEGLWAADSPWIVGSDNVWESGVGNQPIELAAYRFAGSRSILDSLETLGDDGALTCRIRPGSDGYEDVSISPVDTVEIPQRPAPPAKDSGDYSFDFATEEIAVTPTLLQLAQRELSGWTDVAAGNRWTFIEAGWGTGLSACDFHIRFPADSGVAFASSPHYTDKIPARPAAPAGFTFVKSGSSIAVTGLDPSKSYELKEDNGGAWSSFQVSAGGEGAISITDGDIFHLRYAATASLPASFNELIPTLLAIRPVTFTAYDYGATPSAAQGAAIINATSASVPVTVSLQKGGASPFVLSGSAATVAGNSTDNTSLTIGPKSGLSAGVHSDSLELAYTYGGQPYKAIVAVTLQVYRVDWDMSSIAGSIVSVEAGQLTLQITNAPKDAKLAYYFGATPAGLASDSVPAGGGITEILSGLTPATIYSIGVKPLDDGNHNEPAQPKLLATAYTAYATPVFSEVVEVDYYAEQLRFKSGYTASDYTLTLGGSVNTYGLTNTLDTLTKATFTVLLTHNAGVYPPYPASKTTSGVIAGRPAAPRGITAVSATGAASDGKIQLAGSFQYRVHGSGIGWLTAIDEQAGLGAGRYDVRRPPTSAAFASKYAQITTYNVKYSTLVMGGVGSALTLNSNNYGKSIKSIGVSNGSPPWFTYTIYGTMSNSDSMEVSILLDPDTVDRKGYIWMETRAEQGYQRTDTIYILQPGVRCIDPKQSNVGKSFFVAFMENEEISANPTCLYLYAASEYDNNKVSVVNVVSANPYSVVTLNKNAVKTVYEGCGVNNNAIHAMPSYNYKYETPDVKSFRVEADSAISLYAYNAQSVTSEMSYVIPTAALDDEYFALSYSGYNEMPEEFMIIATEDNTLVTITPSDKTYGTGAFAAGAAARGVDPKAAGDPFTVALSMGETYLVRSENRGSGGVFVKPGLTGTHIKASKPIAVFGGHKSAGLPNASCAGSSRDHLFEQLLPLRAWGKRYALVNTSQPSNTYRIVAAYNGTTVTIKNSQGAVAETFTLNRGKYAERRIYTVTSPYAYVEASQPVEVALLAETNSCLDYPRPATGDPFLIALGPADRGITRATFTPVELKNAPASQHHYVNIIVETPYKDQTALTSTGAGSYALSFVDMPNTPYSYAIQEVTCRQDSGYHISNPYGFTAYAYGYASAESYGLQLGAQLGDRLTKGSAGAVRDTAYCRGETPAPLPSCTDGSSSCSDEKRYYWYNNVADWSNDKPLSSPPSFTTSRDTIYTFFVSRRGRCGILYPQQVTVEVKAPPEVTFRDTVICLDAPLPTDYGARPTGGSYTFSGGLGSTIAFTHDVAGKGVHTVTYTYTNDRGCTSWDTAHVEVEMLDTVAVIQVRMGDASFCRGETVLLEVSGSAAGRSFQWYYNDTVLIPGSTSPTYAVAPGASVYAGGKYTARVYSANGCKSILVDTTVIMYEKPAQPRISAMNSIVGVCFGDSYTLYDADTVVKKGYYQWYKTSRDVANAIPGADSSSWEVNSDTIPGIRHFVLGARTQIPGRPASEGCWSYGEFDITVNNLANNAFISTPDSSLEFCAGDSLELTAFALNDNGNTYKWYFEDTNSVVSQLPQSGNKIYVKEQGKYWVRSVSAHGCEAKEPSDTVTIAKRNNPETPTIAIGPPACAGDTITIAVTTPNGGNVTSYQWYVVGQNNSRTAIEQATDSSYKVTENGRYTVRAVSLYPRSSGTPLSCLSSFSAPVDVALRPVPLPPAIIGNTDICIGDSVFLIASPASGSTAVKSYQWNKNGTPMAGYADDTCRVLQVDTSATYTALAISELGCHSPHSAPTTVAVRNPTVSIAGNATRDTCFGNEITLDAKVHPAVDVNNIYEYEWYENDQPIPGATKPSYIVRDAKVAARYYLYVTDKWGCTSPRSDTVTVTIRQVSSASHTIDAPAVCDGDTLRLTAMLSGQENYTWYFERDGNFELIKDTQKDNVYAIGGATSFSSGQYKVRITSSNGCAVEIQTTATVYLLPAKPGIVPDARHICEGDSVKLTLYSTTTQQQYEWYFNNAPLSPLSSKQHIYAKQPGAYSARFMSMSGCWSAMGDTVAIATHPKPAAPVISPPVDTVVVCVSSPVILSASAANATSYEWYANSNGDYTLISNKNSVDPSRYEVETSGRYAARAYILYSDYPLSCPSDFSAPKEAMLFSTPFPPTIATDSAYGCYGDTVTLYATPAPGSPPIASYRWYKNGSEIALAADSAYAVTQVEEASYTVAAITYHACTSSVSIAQKVSIRRPTVSIDNIANNDTSVCFGNSVALTTKTNTGLSSRYEWYKNNTLIAGVNAPTYIAQSGSYSLSGTTDHYRLHVIDDIGCRSATSNAVAVKINELPSAPTVTVDSANGICEGGSVTLRASPSGAESYQWFFEKNGTLESRKTAASPDTTYLIASAQLPDAGWYTVKVANIWRCTSEGRGQVVVHALPKNPSITPSDPQHLCSGDSVLLTAYTLDLADKGRYAWYFDDGNGKTLLPLSANHLYAKTSGDYSAWSVSEHGCTSKGSATVAVATYIMPGTPVISPAGRIDVCDTGAVTITAFATGATSYQWYSVSATNVYTPLVGDTGSAYRVGVRGRYAVRASIWYSGSGYQLSCSSVSETKTVELFSRPSPPVIMGESMPAGGEKTSGCDGDTITLTATPVPGITSYRWYKNGAEIAFAADSACYSVTQVEEALYTAVAISDKGCRSPHSAAKKVAIRTRPTVSISNTDMSVCFGSRVTLSATTNPPDVGGYDYAWYENGAPIPASNSPLYVVQGSDNPLVGKEASCYLFVTDVNGCRSAAPSNAVKVNIRELPPTPVVTSDPANGVCEGSSATLKASPSGVGTYKWFKKEGAHLNVISVTPDATYSIPNAQIADAGLYAVEVTNSWGCKSAERGETMLNVLGLPVVAITKTHACENDTVFNFANPPGGLFSGEGCTGGKFIPADVSRNQAVVAYTYTGPNGCTHSDTTTVEIIRLPSTPIVTAAGPTKACEDSILVTLQVASSEAGYTYQWYKDDFKLPVPDEKALAYVATKGGSYTVRVCNRDLCWATHASAPVVVSVLPLPEPPVIAAQSLAICPDGATTLSVESSQQGTFQWYKGDSRKMEKILNEVADTYIADKIGQYAADFVGENGCRSKFSNLLTIGEHPLPSQPEIIPSQSTFYIGLDYALLVKNPQADEQYGWYKNILSTNVTGPTFPIKDLSDVDTGGYRVKAVNQYGCNLWSDVYVLNMAQAGLFIPNIFTPNGDGLNDYFQIIGLDEFVENKLDIVNKYGKVVFSQENYHNTWNGEGLANDIYYYTLKLKREDGNTSVLNGFVHLKR